MNIIRKNSTVEFVPENLSNAEAPLLYITNEKEKYQVKLGRFTIFESASRNACKLFILKHNTRKGTK